MAIKKSGFGIVFIKNDWCCWLNKGKIELFEHLRSNPYIKSSIADIHISLIPITAP